MEKQKLIGQEVDKIIQCFDLPEEIEINPFLTTRVQAKIREIGPLQPARGIFAVFENMLRPAFIAGLVVLNLVTAGFMLQKINSRSTARAQIISVFAQEYDFAQSEIDILQPIDLR